MNVEVVSTDETLWVGTATSVVVPALSGDLGILAGRQPVLAVLRPGTVRITAADGSNHAFEVVSGFVSCDDDQIEILVDNTGDGIRG